MCSTHAAHWSSLRARTRSVRAAGLLMRMTLTTLMMMLLLRTFRLLSRLSLVRLLMSRLFLLFILFYVGPIIPLRRFRRRGRNIRTVARRAAIVVVTVGGGSAGEATILFQLLQQPLFHLFALFTQLPLPCNSLLQFPISVPLLDAFLLLLLLAPPLGLFMPMLRFIASLLSTQTLLSEAMERTQ